MDRNSLTGANLLAGAWEPGRGEAFRAVSPVDGAALEPVYHAADGAQVARACEAAAAAFNPYRRAPLDVRARFLDRCAEEVEALGDAVVERAMAETGLPRPRLTGELGRTSGQLRQFAGAVRRGEWQGVRIEPAQSERTPLPRPDLRLRKIPLGPVAVFGASNFPLAFSVGGGDTASALAAGCTVVVKGHPAHPGTGELVAGGLARAAESCGLPRGVISLLNGPGQDLGAALVCDPRIKAVGFTGSRSGGLALARLATERSDPIPVFAEMSSVNPVLLLPSALAARGDALARAFVASLTLGAGQFCTNPGLVLAIEGPDLDRFIAAAGAALRQAPDAVMLSPGIHQAYEAGVAALSERPQVTEVARGQACDGPNRAQGGLFTTTSAAFRADPGLAQEIFGPLSLIVACADATALTDLVAELEGQLTTTMHLDPADIAFAGRLLEELELNCGRILVNGWPTGVEVSPAMVHGGPYPATSDGRSTSVGTLAMERFLRPVCYQDVPAALLPAALLPSG